MGKHFKSPLALCLALVMVLGLMPIQARAATSGDFGPTSPDTLHWELTDGTLSISKLAPGNDGKMPSYSSGTLTARPWNDQSGSITSIVLEDGITTVGRYAFANHTALTSISLPEGILIEDHAFAGCTNLERVVIPANARLSENVFYDCTGLKNLEIGDGVTAANNNTSPFSNCPNLESANIPASLNVFGLFSDCSRLQNVTIASGATEIDANAFYGCTALTSLTLPDSITGIGGGAFRNCTNLRSLTLPENLTSIGNGAFTECNQLSQLVIPASVTSLEDDAFDGCGANQLIFLGNRPANFSEITFQVNYDFVIGAYYPYNNSSWTEGFRPDDSENATWTPWVDITNFELTYEWASTIESEGITRISVSSPKLPFDAEAGISLANYTLNGNAFPAGSTAVLSNSNTTVTIDVPEIISPVARAGNVSLGIDAAAFAAAVLDSANGYTQVGSHNVTPELTSSTDDPGNQPTPPDPTPPVPTPSGGSSSSDRDRDRDRTTPAATAPTVEVLPFPEVVSPPDPNPVSPWQDLTLDDQTPIPWIERIDIPAYAKDLYDVLVSGSDPSAPYGPDFTDCLLKDANFRMDPYAPGGTASYQIDEAESIIFTLLDPYAAVSLEGLDTMIFASDDFFAVDVSGSDQAVNYAGLQLGDVVKTASFNGIYVTKIAKGDSFSQDKQDIAAMIATVFQAFDRDHPEVFWLTGKCAVRAISTTASSGEKTAYFFLTLADANGFTMRSDVWNASGAVEDGIRRRDAAVNKILASVTATTPYEQVRQLNKWLTENNEYNTTPDLTAIGNEPHECLSALEGRIGTNGPVCDGYSRAFKVLCGKLGISCILENGYAKTSAASAGTFHMWNSVQVGTGWYGMDVTWNDPVVKGISGAKSGKENENFLLVGASTQVLGMTFSDSHPATNQAITAGVAFTNRPDLSPVAYSSISSGAAQPDPKKPFADVADSAWYAGAVYDVYNRSLMSGTSASTFSPNSSLTRQQIWMMLARLSGQRPAGMTAARAWAMDGAISDGTNPGTAVSRQQLAALLYRNAQSRGLDVSAPENALDSVADASAAASYALEPLRWAVANGLLSAANGTVSPEEPATRAQSAASFARFCEIYKL